MSFFDKMLLKHKLITLGWCEVESGLGVGDWQMVPPESLWQNRPPSFYVYAANEVQCLLGEAVPDE